MSKRFPALTVGKEGTTSLSMIILPKFFMVIKSVSIGRNHQNKWKLEANMSLPASQSIQFSIHVVVSPPLRRVIS